MTSATATTFYGSYNKKQSTYKNIMDFVRNIYLYDNVTMTARYNPSCVYSAVKSNQPPSQPTVCTNVIYQLKGFPYSLPKVGPGADPGVLYRQSAPR